MLAERVLQTIRTRLERYFTHTGKNKYIDVLPQLTSSYNSTFHQSIKTAPRLVNKENEHEVWLNLYEGMIRRAINYTPTPKFKVNDLVRISREKAIFEKGYTYNWSEELFKIYQVNKSMPPTYKIQDLRDEPISGSFLEMELQLHSRPQPESTTSKNAQQNVQHKSSE